MANTGADSGTKHLLLEEDEDGANGGAGTAVATLPQMQGAATSVSSCDPVGAAAADEEAALLQDVPVAAAAACTPQLAGEDGVAGRSVNGRSGGAAAVAASPLPAQAAALPTSSRQQAWPPETVPTLEAVGAALEEPQQRLPLLVAPVWREAATSHTSTGASRVAAAGVAIEMRSLGLPLLREEDARAPAASAALSNISDLERQCFICLQEADRENPLIRCCSTCYASTHVQCWYDWRLNQRITTLRAQLLGQRARTDHFLRCSICKSGTAVLAGEESTLGWMNDFLCGSGNPGSSGPAGSLGQGESDDDELTSDLQMEDIVDKRTCLAILIYIGVLILIVFLTCAILVSRRFYAGDVILCCIITLYQLSVLQVVSLAVARRRGQMMASATAAQEGDSVDLEGEARNVIATSV